MATKKDAKKTALKAMLARHKKSDPEDKNEKFKNLKAFAKEEKKEGEY